MSSVLSSIPMTDQDCDFLYDLTTRKLELGDQFDTEEERHNIEVAYRLGRIGEEARDRALFQIES